MNHSLSCAPWQKSPMRRRRSHARIGFPYTFAQQCLVLMVLLVAPRIGHSLEIAPESGTDAKVETTEFSDWLRIEVYPPAVALDANRRQMHLIVTGYDAHGRVRDVTDEAVLSSDNGEVVRIDGVVIRPVADGTARVVVRAAGQQQTVPVVVTNYAVNDPVSFQYETLPILTRHGCNSGACHGSPSGKAGFRLSLQAYDADLDRLTLIREALGRRTNVIDPAASLLLLKPTMSVSHGGGMRLRKADATYGILRNWIAEGCQDDPPDAAHCVRVEVYPPSGRVIKRPAHTQRLLVLAHFSDGSTRDVTHLAKFSSSDEEVAEVQRDGRVVGKDRGEVAVMVRYLDKVETCFITFVKDIEGFQWTDPPVANYVDELVDVKLRQLKFLPADLCTDEEFLRRVYLDVIGILPTTAEVEGFLADSSASKRSRLIDELLKRPEYATFWALKWGDLLRLKEDNVTPSGVHKFFGWIVRSLQKNEPYDQFCQKLITARGSTFVNPAANYFRTVPDTFVCTESTAQLFLGVRIQCAKCHNHPFERWTQDNYYGMAAFFNRVRQKKGPRPDELVVWVAREGDVVQPRTGATMRPWLPGVGEIGDVAPAERRQALAEWLIRRDNPYFARTAVNRIWAHVMGIGIVDPVDDFRDSNPPSNTKLLDALAVDFVQSGFDRKHILRTILNSRTYQLSARTNEFNRDDSRYFSHARVRMLTAEQLLDAICHVTAVPESFPGLPPGTKATQLPSPDPKNEFLKVFGQPERGTACACERGSESTLSQALQLFNGPLVHEKLARKDNRFRGLIAAGESNEQIVTELFLAALCRKPSPEELLTTTEYVATKDDRTEAFEDVCWGLLNTNEFLFQH